MEEADSVFNQAMDLWRSFKDEILYKNRFILNHPVLDYVRAIAENHKESIKENTILYRARIFNEQPSFTSYLGSDFNLDGLDRVRALHAMCNKALNAEKNRDSGDMTKMTHLYLRIIVW